MGIDTLKLLYKKQHGYTPTTMELYDLYNQGELALSDSEENALLEAYERELL